MKLLLALVFLIAGTQSVSVLTGATIQRNAERLIDTGGNPVSLGEQLAFASRIDPRNVGLLELRLRTETNTLRREEMIREMIRIEPFQAKGWLHLFRHKVALGEIDSELIHVLQKIEVLAPFEPGVQEFVLREGLPHWFEIGPSARRSLVETAVRALQGSAPYRRMERQALVTNGGLLPLVCAVAAETSHCKSTME